MMKKISLSFLFLIWSFASFAANPDDLLKPDDAFSPTLSTLSADRIKATWDIADGYYMYRKRFSFESDTPGITLGTPVFPKGKIKEDPGFGKVETYRKQVSIEIPVTRDPSSDLKLSVKTRSQGCADIGVCYPPQKKTLLIQLLATNTSETTQEIQASSSSGIKTISLADELGITGLGNANQPLHPDEAFAFDISATDKQNLNARWVITDGHYLYQDKIKFSLVDPDKNTTLGQPVLPKGKQEHDEYFGDIVIYNKDFDVKVPVKTNTDFVTIKATYQGCSKLTGICYPPQHKTQTINLASAKAARSNNDDTNTKQAISADNTKAIDDINKTTSGLDSITLGSVQKINTGNEFLDKALNSGSLWFIFLAALGAGLVLAFTACMYPMIPIISSIIAGQGDKISTFKGFILSLVYVLGLAVTFGVIGAITAVVADGVGIQAYFQNPWVLGAFALLFIALSFSMFGFYDIQIPAALQNKLTNISNKQKGGSFIGVAIMGALSALIIGPCGGPVLAGVLSYAALSSSSTSGFVALFALGFGMGLPLLVVGAGGGTLLPKAGNWMSVVKSVAGVILLAVALVILERMPNIFPPGLTMFLWALLLIIGGIYLGAFSSLKDGASGWMKLWKGFGLTAILYGAIVMFGGQTGGQSVTDPLYGLNARVTGGNATNKGDETLEHVVFKRIKTTNDLKKEILLAKQQGKAVMLDFYADWCGYCIKYERYIFPAAKVRSYLDKMVLLQADVTAMDKSDTELMKTLGISLPPAILFFGKDGKEVPSSRVVGEMNVEEFSSHLAKTLK